MKSKSILMLMAVMCLSYVTSQAQQNDTLEIHRRENGKISFGRLKPDINRKITEAANFLKSALQLNPDDELQLIKDVTDNLGITHRLYQQYYKGVKVEDAEYAVHGKNGIIETINGDLQNVNISSALPSINEQQALNEVIKFVHAERYKWEDTVMERFIKEQTNNLNASYYPKGELVVTRDYLKGGNNLRLAWKFSISSLKPNNEQLVYVDAINEQIIRQTPLIYDVNTPCVAETRYSGIVGITGDTFAGEVVFDLGRIEME